MKKVIWSEHHCCEYGSDMVHWENKYEWKVIWTNKWFFWTYLVVACSDKKIREVEISKVEYE